MLVSTTIAYLIFTVGLFTVLPRSSLHNGTPPIKNEAPSAENLEPWEVLSVKLGVGQNINLGASPTARNMCLSAFNFIFSKSSATQQWNTEDAEIKSLTCRGSSTVKDYLFKAWRGSKYSFACFTYWHEYLPLISAFPVHSASSFPNLFTHGCIVNS